MNSAKITKKRIVEDDEDKESSPVKKKFLLSDITSNFSDLDQETLEYYSKMNIDSLKDILRWKNKSSNFKS